MTYDVEEELAQGDQPERDGPDRNPYADSLSAERALLTACLIRPERIGEIVARVKPADLLSSLHRDLLAALALIAEEGRTPSIEALSIPFGDMEIEPRVTVRKYLTDLVATAAKEGLSWPYQDAIEVVIDRTRRRRLSAVASRVMQAADRTTRLSDLLVDGIAGFDDLLAELRSDRRLSYSAADAGAAALARLDDYSRTYPDTGISKLNDITGGWPLGQLSIVAGRPGAGKSAVATSLLLRSAKIGNTSLIFSLEMTKEQLGARLITDLAYTTENPIYYEDVLAQRIRDERFRQRLQEAQRELDTRPIVIEEQQGLTVAEIAARSRKQAAKLAREGRKLSLICVDHLTLVAASDRYAGNRVREVGEISEGLMRLAKELDTAVVALCQLNRAVEGRDNKRPTLADLRESGEIEQNASLVIFLYRAAYYLAQTKFDTPEKEQQRVDALARTQNDLEFIVSKNRNGRPGLAKAFVDMGANAVRDPDVFTVPT